MANAIKNGNDSVTLKVGSETVDAVYLGDTLVYSNGTPYLYEIINGDYILNTYSGTDKGTCTLGPQV